MDRRESSTPNIDVQRFQSEVFALARPSVRVPPPPSPAALKAPHSRRACSRHLWKDGREAAATRSEFAPQREAVKESPDDLHFATGHLSCLLLVLETTTTVVAVVTTREQASEHLCATCMQARRQMTKGAIKLNGIICGEKVN